MPNRSDEYYRSHRKAPTPLRPADKAIDNIHKTQELTVKRELRDSSLVLFVGGNWEGSQL
jgi:hypothetical protein